jgi:hypothetical protein
MHRTRLAEKRGAEALEDAIDCYRSLEEARNGLGIIGALCPVVGKPNGIGQFVGTAIELGRTAERPHQIEKACVKLGYRHPTEGEGRPAPVTRRTRYGMIKKIEPDFDAPGPVRHERSREAARVHVERRMPGMIYPRRAGEPVFPDDLGI